MKIEICSREELDKLSKNDMISNCAVISFTGITYKDKCCRYFEIYVPDIAYEELDEFGYTEDSYLPEADSLAKFIISAITDKINIVCQCEYGQSRSAGCAAAIMEYYNKSGIQIFADYRYCPSQLVFNKVYQALKKGDNL